MLQSSPKPHYALPSLRSHLAPGAEAGELLYTGNDPPRTLGLSGLFGSRFSCMELDNAMIFKRALPALV